MNIQEDTSWIWLESLIDTPQDRAIVKLDSLEGLLPQGWMDVQSPKGYIN